MSNPINTVDPEILKFHAYWKRNREIVAGEHVIRANAANYLIRDSSMSNEDFNNLVKRTPIYPAAARTFQGLVGLMSRTASTINCPDSVRDVLDTITAQGLSIDDLKAELDEERLITDFTGLVADYSAGRAGLSSLQAKEKGLRPWTAVYRAESILGIETGVVNNRRRVVRVRLLDDPDTVRELVLIDGQYNVIMHRKVGSEWLADTPIVPLRNGQPLTEIPFTLDSSSRDFRPVPSPIGAVCALNVDHYIQSANLANETYFSTVRIFVTAGVENEDAEKLPAYSGARWNFPDPDAKVRWAILAPSDNVIEQLREACRETEKHMAAVGLRMLEGDTSGNIAAETQRIRDNAQNASLAALVRRGDRAINDQLRWHAYWMGLEEGALTYETPTDFGAVPMADGEIMTRMQLWQSGAISLQAFINMLIEASVLPETFDLELDQQLVGEEIDLPTDYQTDDGAE